MSGPFACRARPEPILIVEAFLDEHPGTFRPVELVHVLAGALPESVILEVVAYMCATGRAALDDDGRLVRGLVADSIPAARGSSHDCQTEGSGGPSAA